MNYDTLSHMRHSRFGAITVTLDAWFRLTWPIRCPHHLAGSENDLGPRAFSSTDGIHLAPFSHFVRTCCTLMSANTDNSQRAAVGPGSHQDPIFATVKYELLRGLTQPLTTS
jgi:hypothetical protein